MSILRSALQALSLPIYRSRRIAQAIFPISFFPTGPKDYYFDITTVVLVQRVAPRIHKNDHLLDLGTGAHAVVGLSLWKRIGCRVTCSDINPDLVDLAAKNIAENRAPLEVIHSRLFADVTAAFNVVVFNPPYVPADQAVGSRLAKLRRTQFDGGDDGMRVIREFLDDLANRSVPTCAYMGINRLCVPSERILALIRDHSSLSLIEFLPSRVLQCDVYVISNRRSIDHP